MIFFVTIGAIFTATALLLWCMTMATEVVVMGVTEQVAHYAGIVGWRDLVWSLMGTLVGGAIAGSMTLWAANRSFTHQQYLQSSQSRDAEKAFLQAIHSELSTVLLQYNKTMGEHLEKLPAGEPLYYYYPVINDFFTVYNCNSDKFGLVRDGSVRAQIIEVYTLAKGLLASFEMNNQLTREVEQASWRFHETDLEKDGIRLQRADESLREYAVQLKESSREVKEKVAGLLSSIDKYLLDECRWQL